MAKIIAVCGKICSGKSYYSEELKEKENAVILSCAELTKALFDNNLGEAHEKMLLRIWNYLMKLSVQIVQSETSVILDWGFWTKKDRQDLSEYFLSLKLELQWHYIDIDDASWNKNIEERNKRILNEKNNSDYFLDEGLKNKFLSKWEPPSKNEIDVWHKFIRN